jgi:hypothetical protein
MYNIDVLAKQVSDATGIGILEIYQEEEITDSGFKWSNDDVEYTVQVAEYCIESPLLLHKWLSDGCMELIGEYIDVNSLILGILTILKGGE